MKTAQTILQLLQLLNTAADEVKYVRITLGGGGAVSAALAMSAVVRLPIRPAKAAAGSFCTSSVAKSRLYRCYKS